MNAKEVFCESHPGIHQSVWHLMYQAIMTVHAAGVSLEDMHFGNVVYNPKTERVSLIDLKYAVVQPNVDLRGKTEAMRLAAMYYASVTRLDTPLLPDSTC